MLSPRFWSRTIRNFTRYVRVVFEQPMFVIGCLVLAIWLFSSIALVGTFGDEQENFVAAWLVTQGLVPYRDFFFHHAPLPYFLGTPVYLLGSEPWIWFRWLMIGWFGLVGLVTARFVQPQWRGAVGLSWVGLALLAPVLHLQMFLAESLVVPALVSLTILVVSFWQSGKPQLSTVLWLWLILGWVAVSASIVAIPSLGVLGMGILLARLMRKTKLKMPWRWWIGSAMVLYGSWLVYFTWQGALDDAQWAIFTYNWQYYFPLRLAGSAAQAEAGYGITVLLNFWHYVVQMTQDFSLASITLVQTVVGIIKAGWGQAEWFNWLQVAFTEWNHRVVTLPLLSWLLLVLVLGWSIWRRQVWLALWWIGLLITFRGRENESFKLGPYYTGVIVMAVWVWIETWRQKQLFWSGLMGLVFIGWVSLVWPQYQEFRRWPIAIIDPVTVTAGKKLQHSLVAPPISAQPGQAVFILGGNPVYYLLTQRLPAQRYFYYHPWFHDAPPMRQAVTDFLATNTTTPIVLESEIDASSLQYAGELEMLVRRRAATHSAGIYVLK